MNRRKAREKALQILFQHDLNDQDFKQAMQDFLQQNNNDPFLTKIVEGVAKQMTTIDQTLSDHLDHWSIDRLASVEKTVLRIAIYEIAFMEDIPNNVAINEAVELAKKFGEEKSGTFVNGVLSKIINNRKENFNDSRSN